jgi:opacity protein-like surface antigen
MKNRSWLVAGGLFLMLLVPLRAAAEMCESTGEYEYTYGDNESIIQAKQRCENMALRAAIEQCALFVSSTTNIENYELRDDLVNTIVAGLVKNKKILAQRVEGRTVYFKVSIKLDDEQMNRAIEAEQARRGAVQPQTQLQTPPATPAQPAVTQPKTAESKPATTPAQARPRPAKTAAPPSGESRYGLAIQMGQKSLKKDDWDPVEKQGLFGLDFHMGLGALPLQLAAGFLATTKDADLDDGFGNIIKTTGNTSELLIGARYPVPLGRARLYAGAGLDIIKAELKLSSDFYGDASADGSKMGFAWFVGAEVDVVSNFYLGADLRMSSAKPTFTGTDFNGFDTEFDATAGGTAFSVTAGWRW